MHVLGESRCFDPAVALASLASLGTSLLHASKVACLAVRVFWKYEDFVVVEFWFSRKLRLGCLRDVFGWFRRRGVAR